MIRFFSSCGLIDCNKYAEAVLKAVKIRHFFSEVYHRDHCNLSSQQKYVKDLTILGESLENLILIDVRFTPHLRQIKKFFSLGFYCAYITSTTQYPTD